mgnify:FL=1|jgi:hypothetical protein
MYMYLRAWPVADGASAEVYSFGIILWQLCSHGIPYAGLGLEMWTRCVVEGVLRPPLARGWPAELCTLLEECWHVQPEMRPRMVSVHARLRELCGSMQDQNYAEAKQCKTLSSIAAWFVNRVCSRQHEGI